GDSGMPLGGLGAEALLATGDELAGERDLGHEDESLFALGKSLGDRLEIDLGLARTGHAVEERHGEAIARIGEQLVRGLLLLRRERGALAADIERRRVP